MRMKKTQFADWDTSSYRPHAPPPDVVRVQLVFFWTLVARHISRGFDTRPYLRPPMPQTWTQPALVDTGPGAGDQLTLSEAEESQIKDIFLLFDTDGGGTIDMRELGFAMVALGFQVGG